MKEQIEEMAKDLQKSEHWYFDEKSVDFELDRRKTTENLYNAGYRKQKEGEWIDRYNGDFATPIYLCSVCEKVPLLKPYIDELGNMQMVRALSPFCPNCGAKMKGGEANA